MADLRNPPEPDEDLDDDAVVEPEPDEESAGRKREVLTPIRVVERELTRPDGTKLKVDVPVYAPFQLENRHAKPVPLRRALRVRRGRREKREEPKAGEG